MRLLFKKHRDTIGATNRGNPVVPDNWIQLRGGVQFPTGGDAAEFADEPASRASGRNGV